MKKSNKIMALVLAGAMAASMTACGSKAEETTAAPETEAAAETTEAAETEKAADASGKTYKIGVIQLVQHVALDKTNEGFVQALEDAGLNVEIDQQNASGDQSTCLTIAETLVNNENDLIFAIATPAAQSAVNVFQETEIPVLFSSVTDAVGAGLVDSNEAPGKNVTGTLDMPVIADQIAVIKDVLPDVQNLAILYTSSEANSEIQAEEAKKAAEDLGMNVIVQTSSSSNDIPQVIASVVGSAEAIYLPSDNAFASAMATVNKTAVDNQIPVFCAVEAMIEEGGIATNAIDYYELGKQTAAQAVRIIEGENASDIAVETQKECALVINETFAKSVGVEIPASVLESADRTY